MSRRLECDKRMQPSNYRVSRISWQYFYRQDQCVTLGNGVTHRWYRCYSGYYGDRFIDSCSVRVYKLVYKTVATVACGIPFARDRRCALESLL
jgi:hypothetical protein